MKRLGLLTGFIASAGFLISAAANAAVVVTLGGSAAGEARSTARWRFHCDRGWVAAGRNRHCNGTTCARSGNEDRAAADDRNRRARAQAPGERFKITLYVEGRPERRIPQRVAGATSSTFRSLRCAP